jgi:hypothetical protein
MFLKSQMRLRPGIPGRRVLRVVLGLAVSLAIIASTLPLLRRLSGPASARTG